MIMINNNLLNNSTKNDSIIHSSIINKNKIKTDISNYMNLKPIYSTPKLINKLKLTPLFLNNKKNFSNMKSNYLSCDSTMINSINNSNINQIKKIIKFKSENHNNLNNYKSKYKNFILNNNDNLLTDNFFFKSPIIY